MAFFSGVTPGLGLGLQNGTFADNWNRFLYSTDTLLVTKQHYQSTERQSFHYIITLSLHHAVVHNAVLALQKHVKSTILLLEI